ncbi:MAG: NAD-dependent protein deacylase [Lactobacillus equicursoris]|uniref:NAD-dependent protein deacylase n=1 Tax=Lactobacillus equicursoris TaxID=420645 RepID=UPI00242C6385|nr:NAD-dependent protein deacylase [Lactobacillus equicursoris]MDD6406594.1 NAD-dependent protein deacylase [Lactobacillus equicursoris]
MDQELLAEFKQDVKNARHPVFLTGAGVSTHSGIPDYRSKTGIYNGVSEPPEVILSEDTLYNRPELFYKFVMDNMYFPDAKPNLIHEKMAEICNEKGDLITQNIDTLDTKAGNQHVTEFHGNLYDIYCTKCHEKLTYDDYQKGYRHECGGIIRPGIVLYGEGINMDNVSRSVNALTNSDLVIIVGTSFVVYPFAGLLSYAPETAKLWAVNLTEIPAQGIKQLVGDALEVFSQL